MSNKTYYCRYWRDKRFWVFEFVHHPYILFGHDWMQLMHRLKIEVWCESSDGTHCYRFGELR